MTFGSLFSGAGGADIGLERAGMRCLWHCEIDRQASDVLRFRWPEVLNYGDVTQFPADWVEVPDVVWFSPPCQDLSVAGKRAGLAGARSGLFFDATRAVRRLAQRGTRYAVMEQVPGLLSSHAGDDFREALASLWECGPLDLAWRVLDSQWLGVAQRRRRLFLVLDFGGHRAGEILAVSESLCGHPAPSREAGEGTTYDVAPCVGASGKGGYAGRRREDDVNLVPQVAGALGGGSGSRGFCNDLDGSGAFIPQVAGALGGGSGSRGFCDDLDRSGAFIPQLAHALRADGFDASEDGTGRGTPIVPIPFDPVQITCPTHRTKCEPGDPAGACHTRPAAVAFTTSNYSNAAGWESEVYPTVNAQAPSDTSGVQYGIRSGMSVRRLTPRECERLMSWPDDHTRYGRKPDGAVYEQADGPRYKQCGNGVVSNVSEWIGRRIMEAQP